LADFGGAIKNFKPVVLSSTTTKSHATAIATDFIEADPSKISHLLCWYNEEITCSGNGNRNHRSGAIKTLMPVVAGGLSNW